MPIAIPLLIATTVATTAGSIYFQQKAATQQKRAFKAQQQQSALQAAVQRRDAIRVGRAQLAGAAQSAENQGVGTSSGAVGGQGSIVSQVNANLSFLDTNKALNDAAAVHIGAAQQYANYARMIEQVGSAASDIFQASAGMNLNQKKGVVINPLEYNVNNDRPF